MDNITVIIRSSGERTVDCCYEIACNQVGFDNVYKINEVPFSKAVKKTFEIGLEKNKEWTLAIDADIILAENAIQNMIQSASKIGDKLYIYQGYVIDQIFGTAREGGPHLYKTAHLSDAIDALKRTENTMRPESETYKILANEKSAIKYVDNVIYGIHDFEQYLEDYYRKAFFHAKKHDNSEYSVQFLKHWTSKQQDITFKVLLEGWLFGIKFSGDVKVDIKFFRDIIMKECDKNNFNKVEKKPNTRELMDLVNSEIKNFTQTKVLKIRRIPTFASQLSIANRIRNRIGRLLIKTGQIITK